MKNSVRKVSLALVALSTVMCMSVQAGLLATNISGATVVYKSIYEDILGTGSGSFGGTYGTPSSSGGDGIDFTPDNLHSYSVSGENMTTDARLTFLVEAKDGFHITELDFAESGDAILTGAGSANADIWATFFVSVLEVDGGDPVDTIVNGNQSDPYGSFALPGIPVHAWSGSTTLDIQSVLINSGANFDFGATLVEITLDNLMITSASGGSTSLINKKDGDGFTVTAISVPEPASAALMVGMAGAVLFIRRRYIA